MTQTQSNEWIEELFGCSQLNITLNDSFKKTIILNNKQFKYSLKVDKIDDNRNYLCQRCRRHKSLVEKELCSRCANAIV